MLKEHNGHGNGHEAAGPNNFTEASRDFARPAHREKRKKKDGGHTPTSARNHNQKVLFGALRSCSLIICRGPAGTGKTRVACAAAVDALTDGDVDRIILCRPAVEAGEKLGFLPGTQEEKLAPYLRPLYDELDEIMGTKQVKSHIDRGVIEIAPIGHMRGRTLKHAFVLIDEAQNCTYGQLKMLATRLGEGSTMVFAGDPSQNDLPDGQSGFEELARRLKPLIDEDITIVELENRDIVRHPVVKKIAPHL
jgi:phosphate starvation-inducible PhoH-like protein